MATRWFMTGLTLVSALAQALVYGLGGYLALTGHLAAGTVVSLALLLTRLYAPLTALANARVDLMTALVSFERVFEVLDLDPMIKESPTPRTVPVRCRCRWSSTTCASRYPSAEKVSLASLESVATLDTRGGEEVLHGISFSAEGRSAGGAGRLVRRGQVDARVARAAALRRRLRQRCGCPVWTFAT